MIIRHAINPSSGAEYDNKFVAVDEQERELGTCLVESRFCERMFPMRPHQIVIDIEGDKAARAALLGAATAQAMLTAMRENLPARIYAPCEPDDTERIVQLNEFGYEDNDGVVRMARFIKQMPQNPEIPQDVIALHDTLEDAAEARYFLKRYNRLYDADEPMELVEELTARPGFRRYLLIHEDGLLGEVLVSLSGDVGTILFIQVNANYCRRGLGTYLMQLAIYMLAKRGATRIEMDVRVRVPGIMRFLKKLDFEQYKLVQRYLGMDWDPGMAQQRLARRIEAEEDEIRAEWEQPAHSSEKPIAQDPADWD